MAQKKKNKKNKNQNVNNVDVSENEKPSKNSQKRAQRQIGKRVVYRRKAIEREAKQQSQNTAAQNDATQVNNTFNENNAINENIEVNVNIAQPQEKKNEPVQNSLGMFGELPQQRNPSASILNDDYLRVGQRKIPGLGYVEPMKKEEEKKPEQQASQGVPSSGMSVPGMNNNNSQAQAPLNQLTEEERLTLRLKSEEYNLQNLRKQRVSSPQQLKAIQNQISQKEDEIDDIKLRLGLTTQEKIDARKKEAQLKEQERNKVELRNLERQLASFSEVPENARDADKEWIEKNKKSIEKEIERLKTLIPENERLPINDEAEINHADEPVIIEDNNITEGKNHNDWLREREEDLARRAQEHRNRVNSGNVLNDIENKLENDRKSALSRVQANKELELNPQKVNQVANNNYEALQRAMEDVDARLSSAQERLDTLLKAQAGNVYEQSLRNSQIEYLRDLINDLNAVKNFGADIDEPAMAEDQAQPEHNNEPNQNQPEVNGEIRFFPEDNIKLTREDIKLKIAELNDQILSGVASVEGHNPRRFVSMDELRKEVSEEIPDGTFDGLEEMLTEIIDDSPRVAVFMNQLGAFNSMYKCQMEANKFALTTSDAWKLMKSGDKSQMEQGQKMMGDLFKGMLKQAFDMENYAAYNEHRQPAYADIVKSANDTMRATMFAFTDLYHNPESAHLFEFTSYCGLDEKEIVKLTADNNLWKMDQSSDEAWEIQSLDAKNLAEEWLKDPKPYEKMINEMNSIIESSKKDIINIKDVYKKLTAAEWLLFNNEKMMIEDPEDPLNPIPNWGNRYWKSIVSAREALGIPKHSSMRDLIQSDYSKLAKSVCSTKYKETQIYDNVLDPTIREFYDSFEMQMEHFATQSAAAFIGNMQDGNLKKVYDIEADPEGKDKWPISVKEEDQRKIMKNEPKVFSNIVLDKSKEAQIEFTRE